MLGNHRASADQNGASISVVVVPFAGRTYIQRCLDALMRQAGIEDLEIVVPCDDRMPDLVVLERQFPAVQFLPIEGRRTYAELRAFGVEKARGAIVALTEDHCIPESDWCAQVLEAHRVSHAVIGGAVEKVGTDTWLDWAMYLADYARYMNPAESGPRSSLTDCNVSYRRSALAAISDVWRHEFHEPDVHAAIRARGEILWFSPRVVVRQDRRVGLLTAIRDRFVFGRLFGGRRAASMSYVRRGAYAACCVGLPVLLPARVALHALQKRSCLGPFLFSLPALTLLSAVWALGEFVGYVTGQQGESMVGGADRVGETA